MEFLKKSWTNELACRSCRFVERVASSCETTEGIDRVEVTTFLLESPSTVTADSD